MNTQHMKQSLAQLIELRERELERYQAKLATQEQLRARYASTVQRLEQLNAQIGPTGAAVPTLAANNAVYKQAVMQWAEQQRQDLALHEADMAVQRQAMLEVARKQEAYGQLLARMSAQALRESQRREQKQQDDLAGQVWQRSTPGGFDAPI
ncbi:flagellar export protein FliJ [Roseateles sp. DAIF2]|uniref:flagellar FliJ family protein n=1 Tax=Roseateles sp. DAIF2 TaxID=2714952 RepID=UPI0018A2CC04|nr:flagellar FliJ family protein [Roseateles sp. DAIF2]QPF74167.1 flagellar export protein FliJ [Roseateles sp. DAIF2]